MGSNVERIVRLEEKVETHEERLDSVELRVGVLHKDLSKLIGLTSHIKWWLIGVGSFYIAQEVGVMPLIKKFIGL
jgi:hypothetical protein